MESALKVLFVIGSGRSGSTILDNLLGEIDGVFSGGEIHNLWTKPMEQLRPCGCGRPVDGCPVWSDVAGELNAAWGNERLLDLNREVLDVRRAASLLKGKGDEATEAYAGAAADLYRTLRAVTGARVVVDSTKRPALAALALRVAGIHPYVLHLIRDPRAVAYSWRRSTGLRTHGSIHTTSRWVALNVAAGRVERAYGSAGMRMRYEDFVKEPRRGLEEILSLLDEVTDRVPIEGERTALLGPNHAVAGNPSRFRTGSVSLKEDDEWRTSIGSRDRVLTTGLSLPLLMRYGYRIRSRA